MAITIKKGKCFLHEEKGKIFIDIPKNASTSIKKMLEFTRAPEHMKDLSWLGVNQDKHEVFCVLREPIERLVSGYLEMLNRIALRDLKYYDIKDMPFYKIANERKRFHSFIDYAYEQFKEGKYLDDHIIPQSYFLEGFKIDVYLDFNKLYDVCPEYLGVEKVAHENMKGVAKTTQHMNYLMESDYLDKVKEMYSNDIKLINEKL